jgi:phage-related protein
MGTTIKTVITGIGTFLSSAWATISGLLTSALTAAKAGITAALGAIKTAVSSVISFIIANPIALIIAAIVALVALIAVKGDEIQNALNRVSQWISGIFVRDWRQVFGNTLGTIMNGFVKIIGDIMTNVKKILNGIIDFIRGVFTGNWKRAWEGIKQIFSGIFGGLAAIAKAPLNAVITLVNGLLSAITSGLNAVKRALNTISISIPDWVPKYGGKKFGFNFSMSTAPKIPMLATGGIVTRSTLANIGENGKEAVLPLDRNTGWMDQLADRIAARQQTPTKIVLKVGEKELGWASINGINQITKQTGGLKLQLV